MIQSQLPTPKGSGFPCQIHMKIFQEIKNYDDNVLFYAFGDIGKSLKKFSYNLNFDHFGVKDIPIDQELENKLFQILELVKYALDNNLLEAIKDINKFYKKIIPKELEKIDNKFIRLIKDYETRKKIRDIKKVCEVGLHSFYEKASIFWDNSPEDFELYSRFSTKFKDQISAAEIKAQRYKDLGCQELFEDINKSIQNIKNNFSNDYFGYRKISLRTASIVLAKINGFKLNKKENVNCFDQKYIISINEYLFKPVLYPFSYLEDISTQSTKNLMDELEKIPLFDYYMVLVPSTDKSDQEKDFIAIRNKNIIPIIIGEKDGKCYFISHWI